MVKLLIALIGLLIAVLIVLIVKMISQKREITAYYLQTEHLLTFLSALAHRGTRTLTFDLANKTSVETMIDVQDNIKLYYQGAIEFSTFSDLAKDIYELENLFFEFQKKRLLLDLFTAAALQVNINCWVKLLMSYITDLKQIPSPHDQYYFKRAARLENFIICIVKQNHKLSELECKLEREIILIHDNGNNTKAFNEAIGLLQKIRDNSN